MERNGLGLGGSVHKLFPDMEKRKTQQSVNIGTVALASLHVHSQNIIYCNNLGRPPIRDYVIYGRPLRYNVILCDLWICKIEIWI